MAQFTYFFRKPFRFVNHRKRSIKKCKISQQIFDNSFQASSLSPTLENVLFSGNIEREHWPEIGRGGLILQNKFSLPVFISVKCIILLYMDYLILACENDFTYENSRQVSYKVRQHATEIKLLR